MLKPVRDLANSGLIRRWRKHIKSGAMRGGSDRVVVALRDELTRRGLWRVVYGMKGR